MGFRLFRSKRDKDTRPALRSYGKLPITREFLQIEAFDGAASAFKDWLDRCGDSIDSTMTGVPTRVLFCIPGQKELIVATVWPSQDKGTGRRFPFSFFATIPLADMRPANEFPHTFVQPLWDFFDKAYEKATLLQDRATFYAEFSDRTTEVELSVESARVSWSEWLKCTRIQDWAESLYPVGGVDSLIAALWMLRSQSQDGDTIFLIPKVADGEPLCSGAWATIYRSLCVSECDFPSIALMGGDASAALLWGARNLRSEESTFLLGIMRVGMEVSDLTTPENPLGDEHYSTFADAFRKEFIEPTASVETLLHSEWLARSL